MVKINRRQHITKNGIIKKNPSGKIKVKNVVLLWREGPTIECDRYPLKFSSIKEANRQIMSNAMDAPRTGGYDKHAFKVTWMDGNSYSGRMDVKHPSQPNPDLNIGQHMKEEAEYYIYRDERASLEEKNNWRQFLEKYDLELN